MRNFLGFGLLLALLLPTGCAVEEPYPSWPAPPSSLSPKDVVQLLLDGIPEDDVIAAIQATGISERPTASEIQALRLVGASERMLAEMVSAAPLLPRVEPPAFYWLPIPPSPGCWPVDPWLWLEAMLKAYPRPEPPLEAEP